MNKQLNILLCGVGGDGIVLLSRIIAESVLKSNLEVKSSENRGHGKRGGPVVSHIRIGKTHSPTIPEGHADVLVAFNHGECLRWIHYLKRGGIVLVNSEFNDKTIQKYSEKTCNIGDKASSHLPQNMLFLGFLTAKILKIKKEVVEAAIAENVRETTKRTNLHAFEYGYDKGCLS